MHRFFSSFFLNTSSALHTLLTCTPGHHLPPHLFPPNPLKSVSHPHQFLEAALPKFTRNLPLHLHFWLQLPWLLYSTWASCPFSGAPPSCRFHGIPLPQQLYCLKLLSWLPALSPLSWWFIRVHPLASYPTEHILVGRPYPLPCFYPSYPDAHDTKINILNQNLCSRPRSLY